jgi:DNA repair protein RadC
LDVTWHQKATGRIEEAAGALGLRFLDHVVLTDSTWSRVPSTA